MFKVFSQKSLLFWEKTWGFFLAEPQALLLSFLPPLPTYCVWYWAASAGNKGRAGGKCCPCLGQGQAPPVGCVGHVGLR